MMRRSVRGHRAPTGLLATAALGLALAACRPSPLPEAPREEGAGELLPLIDASLQRAAVQYAALDDALPDTLFPRTLHPDGSLRTSDSRWWTSGFFPGSLWHLYGHTGDPDLRRRALARTRALEREQWNGGDHDIGFRILSSYGNAFRLTGDSAFLPVIVNAARTLTTRFDSAVGAIRSWGTHPDTTAPYLVIIDNLMNLELLFRATEITGDRSFADVAVRHADTTLRDHYRPDGSAFHVVEYDPVTGAVIRKRTEQGHADASAWARGQAWGLYGYTVAYRETGYDRYLEQANRIAGFLLTHPNLPADGVPYWDLDAPGIPETHRDASAAAIMASALLELSAFVDDSLRAAYRDRATTALRTLTGPEYRTAVDEGPGFLLRHGVGHRPAGSEVDVPLSYADYYYLEGLLRLRGILSDDPLSVRVVPIGKGWARSSVNTVIFRQHGLVTRDGYQYAAYYDPAGRVLLARRPTGAARWETRVAPLEGDVADAHNAISLAVDGNGVLHLSWDLHGDVLRYARGVAPRSLELGRPMPMTGRHERQVTYPRFYPLAGGDLLFLYRDGGSGDGDVMVNRYHLASRAWRALHHPLIDGSGERSAYLNGLAIDSAGGWHLSWVWRDSPDAASNHDILYAYSPDEGDSWLRSTGEPYALPITEAAAEVAVRVPPGSGLINQTTMTVDAAGRPLIASYWRDPDSDVPQYRIVRHDGTAWRTHTVGRRSRPFTLEGGGTLRIPISRPLVLADRASHHTHLVFRDTERGGGIVLASTPDLEAGEWTIRELFTPPVGLWEPVHDPVAWDRDGELHLLVQHVGQGDGETLEELPPQTVRVIEWKVDGPA